MFTTKIYHPNVDRDGDICLECTRNWGSAVTMKRIVLAYTNSEHAVTPEIGAAYRDDRAAFEEQARRWTAQYAH